MKKTTLIFIILALSHTSFALQGVPPPPPPPDIPSLRFEPTPPQIGGHTAGITCFDDPRIMREDSDSVFIVGTYLINPARRMVGTKEAFAVFWHDEWGWSQHAEGEHFVHNEAIDFNTTTLFVLGNQLFFKEEMEFFDKLDLYSLQILHTDLQRRNPFHFFARDKNHLYIIGAPQHRYVWNFHRVYQPHIINIANYFALNNRMYVNIEENNFYFLSDGTDAGVNDIRLARITNPEVFDFFTLRHLRDNYFYDKNGLYFLRNDEQYYTAEMVESDSVDIGTNERIDTERFSVYQNRLYSFGTPIATPIDTENFRFVAHHGQQTNFMTDDNLLIYRGFRTFESVGTGADRVFEIRESHRVAGVDFETLRVITPNMLMDRNNFYMGRDSGSNQGITVVPIEALGVNVWIFVE